MLCLFACLTSPDRVTLLGDVGANQSRYYRWQCLKALIRREAMLLLDDGTHFTANTSAATKTAKASRPMWLKWMHRVHWQPPTQVFLDSVVQRIMARRFVRQQPVRQQPVRQQPVRQQPIRQQPVRQQRSILEAISSQLSALPPPVVSQPISPPRSL